MIQTVVFDLVGVVIHVNPRKIFFRLGFYNVCSYVLFYRRNPIKDVFRVLDDMRTQFPGEYQAAISFKKNLLPKAFCDFQRGSISSAECLQRVCDFFEYVRPDGYFISTHQEVKLKHFMNVVFTPAELGAFFEIDRSIHTFLTALKATSKYKLYLFSNIDAEAFAVITERFPSVMTMFDGIVTSYETGYLKPEQEIYDILYQKYGIDPQYALYIDDQDDNIHAAQKHGVLGVHYLRSSDLDWAKKICL